METIHVGILSLVTFLPLVGAIVLMLLPKERESLIRYVALATSVATLGASAVMLSQFRGGTYHFQLVEYLPWFPNAGINFRMGVDGISVWLVMLTTFLSVISIWFSFYVSKRVKAYMVFMLILETAMLGVFLALDMVLFYTFFEASLIPMAGLIAIWGGDRRIYASVKFFVFTFAGSIFMLIGIIALYLLQIKAAGTASFSIIDIQESVANGKLWVGSLQLQTLLFWAFALGFLIKCPAFPFHTWLPDAHVEAPTAGSVILAGVLLKMGSYGILRFCLPLFPDVVENQVPIITGIAVIGIIYGAIVSAVQPDVKKLIAYSSVAHMGFVLLGIFSLTQTGMIGGSYQQINHGVSTGALFLLVGLIYERRHTRLFKDYGGLKAQMPIFAALFLIMMLSSVGLPGLNGFVGEFLAMMGAFEAAFSGSAGISMQLVVVAACGVILAAVYLLWMFQKMFYGPITVADNKKLKDLKPWEIVMVGTLVVAAVWGGLFPNTFLQPMQASIGATRMMSLNIAGERPSWKNLNTEIDEWGRFVQTSPRKVEDLGEPPVAVKLIAPANIHFGGTPEAIRNLDAMGKEIARPQSGPQPPSEPEPGATQAEPKPLPIPQTPQAPIQTEDPNRA